MKCLTANFLKKQQILGHKWKITSMLVTIFHSGCGAQETFRACSDIEIVDELIENAILSGKSLKESRIRELKNEIYVTNHNYAVTIGKTTSSTTEGPLTSEGLSTTEGLSISQDF